MGLDFDLLRLSDVAWQAWAKSTAKSQVGCAVLDSYGFVFSGYNIEHRFRCHDLHAEVVALANLKANGGGLPRIIFVASQKGWTPCGSCMDWIIQLGGLDVLISTQSESGAMPYPPTAAREFMPQYPR